MKKIVLNGMALLIAQCFILMAIAQKSTISGIINDGSLQKPLQYVTVELHKGEQLSPQPLKVTFTTDKGKYNFSGIDTGNYTLLITHTGFAEVQEKLTVTGQSIEVKPVSLSASASTMKGIVVTARKPLIEQQDDKIIFNVENDPATKTETAIDILRKTPFVTVDGDNNVTVNGQTNFKVLLNGRETGMFAQNPKEALKGFPGSVITKI
jgi:hypothetical protein